MTDILQDLKWETLAETRPKFRCATVNKVTHAYVDVPILPYFHPGYCAAHHSYILTNYLVIEYNTNIF